MQDESDAREAALQPKLTALAEVPSDFTTFTKNKCMWMH